MFGGNEVHKAGQGLPSKAAGQGDTVVEGAGAVGPRH